MNNPDMPKNLLIENLIDNDLSKKDLYYKRMFDRLGQNYSDKYFMQYEQVKSFKNQTAEPNFNLFMPILNVFKKIHTLSF